MLRDVYVASVEIAADPETIFDYFTDPDLLVRWMGRRAVLDPSPGGEFSLDIYRVNIRGRYLQVDRPHRIVLSWGHEGSVALPPGQSIVEVTFTPLAGNTLVRVEHRDLPADEAADHESGWQHFLPRLAAVASGNDPGSDPWMAHLQSSE